MAYHLIHRPETDGLHQLAVDLGVVAIMDFAFIAADHTPCLPVNHRTH